jgi:hypothetical protein
VCISETWLHDNIKLTAFNQGFSVFRHDRSNTNGGGVLIAVASTLRSNFVHSNSFGTCECIFVDVLINDLSFFRIGSVYRPPNTSVEDSLNLFDYIKSQLENTMHFAVYGDFNLSDIDWCNLTATSHVSNEFLLTCLQIGATQCVDFPTRNENLLDLILCSDRNLIQEIHCTEPLSTSDHCSISFKIQPLKKERKSKPMKPCFKKADYAMINSFLMTVDWESLYSECATPDDYYRKFKGMIDYIIITFVPHVDGKTQKIAPWYNDKLKHLKRVKQRHWQRYTKNRNIVKYAQYKESAQSFSNELLKTKCEYEKKLFDGRKSDCKKFYNYIRKQTTVCSEIPCLNDEDYLATSDEQKADLLSKYFGSVFVEDNNVMPTFDVNCESNFDSFSCDTRTMIKIVKKLKLSSSPGPDGITPLFLKNIIANIAEPLSKLFNVCLSTGHVPIDWKIAHVIPIFKKGNPQLPSNYRPVSLTSILCKVLERVVRKQMISYLFDNDIIPRNQHGFLSKKSTVSNLVECLDRWTNNYDKALQTDIVYLDYSKCFDSVVHSKLLHKLSQFGFVGSAYNWIESFLLDRVQYVKVGACISQVQHVLSGVPQGTVLGPLLFLCFSSDIVKVVQHSQISMYADDTKVYKAIRSINDCESLQIDLNNVFRWASMWQLKLNAEKTKHLRLGNCRYEFTYSLDGSDIQNVDSICDIGVHIQSNLKFTNHCNSIIKKGYFNVRNVLNTFKGHDRSFYVNMYKTYIRPILESSSPVWSPHNIGNIDRIESVQRFFTRKLPGMSNMSYADRLSVLDLESLEARRIKADLILYYKVLHGLIDIDIENSIRPYHSHRGHNFHLYHFYNRTDARKNFWAHRIVHSWNNLDSKIVNSSSVHMFKNALNNVTFSLRGSAT